jgi:SRSO17 transposase
MDTIVERYEEYRSSWLGELENLFSYIGYRFGRREMRERSLDYPIGLLSTIERKNGWQLAEAAAHAMPYSVQHLLDQAHWDCDAVRGDLVDYLAQELGDEDAILVVDEAWLLKKGQSSAGVQRRYSGMAGGIENCRIGVLLSYSSQYGHALIDSEVYLPRSWTDDMPRRSTDKSVEFATKPQLARQMIERAVAAKMPFGWIIGDEVYGDDRRLRIWLEQEDFHYVLAVASNQQSLGFALRHWVSVSIAAPDRVVPNFRLRHSDSVPGIVPGD